METYRVLLVEKPALKSIDENWSGAPAAATKRNQLASVQFACLTNEIKDAITI